jgi:putative ABC transport system permease protein
MLKNYLKIAWKVFLRRKFFTFISLFGISFTLIVLMVVVALFDHQFAKHPPEANQDRTIGCFALWKTDSYSTYGGGPPGYKFLDLYTRDLPYVEKYSFFTSAATAYSYLDGDRIVSFLKRTDGAFWQIFQFDFLEGGPFSEEDNKNANFVAVINEATRRKFFGDQPAVGKMIEADGQRFHVVGVVANISRLRSLPFSEIWVPVSTSKSDSYRRQLVGNFTGIYLVRDKADIPAVQEEFRSRLGAIMEAEALTELAGNLQTYFESISSSMFGGRSAESRSGILWTVIVLGAVLFMILPAVNLININFSRIMERASEIGIRKAFGASSASLVVQFVVENVLLSLAGGLVALAGSCFVLAIISRSGTIPYASFHINYRIFACGLTLAAFFGVFSGTYPAWRMSRLHPVDALKGEMR